MDRLKIPSKFTDLILSFFTHRTNAIITSTSVTAPYDIKVGIDQGEVISPLLWTIYYDPLFYRIKGLQHKYTVSINRLKSIDPLQYEQLLVECNLLGYLDDTTWITSSKEDLETMLSIADSYYTFMNIKVNKQKSILMTNNYSSSSNGHVSLHFGADQLTLPNTPKESIRFLGV